MMKRRPILEPKYALLLGLVLLVVAILLARGSFKAWSAKPTKSASNNPQDFFVSSTKSTFQAYFRYDPRAADEWLFHSGVGLVPTWTPTATLKYSTQ
jgi:hypothetical protein